MKPSLIVLIAMLFASLARLQAAELKLATICNGKNPLPFGVGLMRAKP
jgi:hypothetical protein